MPSKDHIKQHRDNLGLSQQDLAERIREWWPTVEWTVISKIENGRRHVLADELPMFAIALQCSVENLVDELPQKKRAYPSMRRRRKR